MELDWDCIEFTRTVGWEERDRDDDELSEFSGLVGWCVDRDLLDAEEADAFLEQARKRPGPAAAALEEAHAARVLAYAILRRLSAGEPLATPELDELNSYLQRFLTDRRLHPDAEGGGARWEWRRDPYRPSCLLGPVMWSLADLLTSPERRRVKVCDADDCGWIFIDASRNRSRRWCDMSDCGNRAKARRFRARHG